MPALPSRSPGVLISGLQGEFVVYDLVTETVHDLNGTAGELLARCDGATPTDDLVDEWVTRTGTDRPEIAHDVDAALAEFTRLGLVDRRGGWTPPPRLAGSTATPPDGAVTGAAHPALDRRVVFRSTDRALVDAIDGFLGAGTLEVHGPPAETLPIDVERLDDGSIRADVGDELHFPGLDAFLSQITSVINRLTAGPGAVLALHAGAVRSPVGEVVVVTAPSGSGKSTLVAALVQAGWDYLGDETIGVRPDGTAVGYPKRIGLDDASRAALGLGGSSSLDNPVTDLRADVVRLAGDVVPVSRTFLVEYLPGATPRIGILNVQQGFKALLANTLTFGADAPVGLDTLCAPRHLVDGAPDATQRRPLRRRAHLGPVAAHSVGPPWCGTVRPASSPQWSKRTAFTTAGPNTGVAVLDPWEPQPPA